MKTSFSGHETFEIKSSWLPLAYKNMDVIFGDIEQAIAICGIGANKVKSLRQWLHKFSLLEGDYFTKEASIIFSKDPYLESLDTLWILHAYLTQNREKATLYYLFFNRFYISSFTKESLKNKLLQWCTHKNINMAESTLDNDIGVLTRMYQQKDDKNLFTASVFHDLNILHKIGREYYLNVKNPAKLSDEAFLYIFLYFIRSHEGNTISVKDLQYGDNYSLLNTLCLTEERFLEKLERLSDMTNGQIAYQEAAGIKQIYLAQIPDLHDVLNSVYEKGDA